MSKAFREAYLKTQGFEGGYSNDPVDRGGETYKGIARAAWPNWQGWVLIDRIKTETGGATADINREAGQNNFLQRLVEFFYKEIFWDANKLDSVPVQIASEVFDTSVNMGQRVGIRFLQEALNLCNNRGLTYPNIKVDGLNGPVTLSTLKRADQVRVLKTMSLLQGERYLNIMRKDESQERFWGGWLSRVFK